MQFAFDSKRYEGLEGDTLAAALLSNGIDIVGRGFVLQRPRGIVGAGVKEPNGRVQLEAWEFDDPNVPATMTPLSPGLHTTSQHA
ncbi:2Fe-2S iron-sulfur cluster-binding protein [Paraburkholderia sp. GAS32]|uniref:2Fe-2S iron-sulfur cluster-binding protein n=1 Tax=Paraburkholderia sp. GAS32 TaxID=3035129 RepID=UPI003D25DE43